MLGGAAVAAVMTGVPAALAANVKPSAARHVLPAAHAATPQAVVERFDTTLLKVMQQARELGYQGRYDTLAPVMSQAFDFAGMARVAAGPAWFKLTPAEQEAIVKAFERYSIATYAAQFDSYAGERFVTTAARSVPQGTMITAALEGGGDQPVTFGYLLHKAGGAWRIIDIYLNGTISQLAVRRSEFSSILARSGPDGLISRLDQKTEQLAQGTAS